MVYSHPLFWLFVLYLNSHVSYCFSSKHSSHSILFSSTALIIAASLYFLCILDYSISTWRSSLVISTITRWNPPPHFHQKKIKQAPLSLSSIPFPPPYHIKWYLRVGKKREDSESGIICFEGNELFKVKGPNPSYPFTFTSLWNLYSEIIKRD